eukprot:PLAT11180.1.p1 GENE.PLAT11180.1~~PLAT11180.1.p1  ORF type:complete len:290 (+),score=92.91 PLAT11180.1:57-872(+)
MLTAVSCFKLAGGAVLAAGAVLIAEAAYVRLRTPRLPEAPGRRRLVMSGEEEADDVKGNQRDKLAVQNKDALQLLVLGDSVAAGVGCSSMASAVAGATAGRLSARISRPVQYSVLARSGYTLAHVRHRLMPRLGDYVGSRVDVVILSCSMNSLLSGWTPKRHEEELKALVADVRHRFPAVPIFMLGLPDVSRFPALPWPFNRVLLAYAQLVDARGKEVLASIDDAYFVPSDISSFTDRQMVEYMAKDGFHPGDLACSSIAEESIGHLLRVL